MIKKIMIPILIVVFTMVMGITAVQYMWAASYIGVISYTDVSAEAGIDLISPTWGISWGDVNADGLEDVYLSNHQYFNYIAEFQYPPSLFVNQGDGTFLESNEAYGLIYWGDQHGAAWGDIDNDGFPELFQTQGSNQGKADRQNFLYYNDGEGSFTVIPTTGVELPRARGRMGSWFDYDNDGLLDLYISNAEFEGNPSSLYLNLGDGTFEDIGEQAGVVEPQSKVNIPIDYNNDGLLDLFIFGNPLRLFKNMGDGTYEDVAPSSFPPGTAPTRGCAWGDYDNDGDMDLYFTPVLEKSPTHEITDTRISFYKYMHWGNAIGFDFELADTNAATFDLYNYAWRLVPGLIYLGQNRVHPLGNPFLLTSDDPDVLGDPLFTPGEAIATFIWFEDNVWHVRSTTTPDDMNEVFAGYITTDGRFLNVAPYSSNQTGSIEQPVVDLYSNTHYDLHMTSGDCCVEIAAAEAEAEAVNVPGRLYENLGDGTFVEVAEAAGLSGGLWGQSAMFADFDNDGYLDLYVVNADTLYNQPNQLYMNNGDKTFTDIAVEAGVEVDVVGKGESAAYSDYNNDGFLDIFVSNGQGSAPFNYGRHTLLRNEGNGNHWLKIKLTGTASNRDAIGSTVTIQVNGTMQMRQHNGQIGNRSQNSPLIHFGLGDSTQVDQLTVVWPGGIVQELYNVPADNALSLLEPSVDATIIPINTDLIPGDNLEFTAELRNLSHRTLEVDVWSVITNPNSGQKTTPSKKVIISSGEELTKDISHRMSPGALVGTYTVDVFVGVSSNSWVWESESFDFTVSQQ